MSKRSQGSWTGVVNGPSWKPSLRTKGRSATYILVYSLLSPSCRGEEVEREVVEREVADRAVVNRKVVERKVVKRKVLVTWEEVTGD